jgi:hypothetical protein
MGGWRRVLAVAGALYLLGGPAGFGAPLERFVPRPFKVLGGIKVGQEGVSRAPGVDGGSYLCAELSAFSGPTSASTRNIPSTSSPTVLLTTWSGCSPGSISP